MEITVKQTKITLTKDYLTNGEVNYIVSEALKIYLEGGDIEGYDYSLLAMLTNFYALLFAYCIEGYNIDSVEDFDKYYNIGAHYELMKKVTNADEAYHLVMSLSKDLISVENIIDKNMNKLINMVMEKIPDAKTMNKMINKLPKEWQKVASEYNEITGKKTQEEDE